MSYPSNSREVAFLPIADCRRGYAALVRELDKLDEHEAFGPEGWRTWLTPLPQPLSMSKALREANALLGDGVIGSIPPFEGGGTGSLPVLPATPPNELDKSEVIVVT